MAAERLELVGHLWLYSQEGGYADDSISIDVGQTDFSDLSDFIKQAFSGLPDRDGNRDIGRVRIVIERLEVSE